MLRGRFLRDSLCPPWIEQLLVDCPPTLLCAEAGDLILWDSRVAHCSTSSLVPEPEAVATTTGLQRVTCQICMTPRSWASEEVLAQREQAVRTGSTSSHWPHGPGVSTQAIILGSIKRRNGLDQAPDIRRNRPTVCKIACDCRRTNSGWRTRRMRAGGIIAASAGG